MIDHGHCFTGPQWGQNDLTPPDVRVANRLKDWLTPVLADRQREQAAHRAAELASDVTLDFSALAAANYLAELLDDGDFAAVVNFLQGRRPHTAGLAAEALGMLA